jgi:IS5 family transposase
MDWRRFEHYLDGLYSSAAGRPAYNPLMMFKALILQFLYDLSDRQLEEQLDDRISFRYFLGLDPTDSVPDHTVYCRFRDRLGAEVIAELFNEVVGQSRERGLVKDRLCIVDATHVQAKVNTYRMNSERDDDMPNSPSSSVDKDARHGYKSKNKPFFGYKVGIGMDKDSNIVTKVTATPGNEHDSTHFGDIADPNAKAVAADKGYDNPENFKLIKERKQKAAIMVKKRKNKQRGHIKARYSSPSSYQYYYRMKKFRPLVEKIFASAKQWYGLQKARYWGLAKMKIQAIMTMMAMNLKRIVLLDNCVQT